MLKGYVVKAKVTLLLVNRCKAETPVEAMNKAEEYLRHASNYAMGCTLIVKVDEVDDLEAIESS